MSRYVIAWALGYALIAVVLMSTFASDAVHSHTYADERRYARYALASVVWPLLLVWALGRGLVWLWRAADLGRSS